MADTLISAFMLVVAFVAITGVASAIADAIDYLKGPFA